MEANLQEKSTYKSREEKNGVTGELVRKYFDYKDGRLYRKIAPNSKTKIGELAGGVHKGIKRYQVGIDNNHYLGSRIIFLYHNDYLPEVVDHKDNNQLNDRIENLREATRTENNQNSTCRRNKSSQYLGVYLKENKYWIASIQVNKIQKNLGYFKTEIEAALAYNKAAVKYFKEFANLNIIKP